MCGHRRFLLDASYAVVQMANQALLNANVDAINLADVAVHLIRAIGEACLELMQNGRVRLCTIHVDLVALHILQIFDRHFQNVGFFQFRMPRRLRFFTNTNS